MNEKRYYVCPVCGNIVEVVSASGVNVKCCGKNMEELVPGVVEASHEKHIPVVKIEGERVLVDVGSVIHPMSEEQVKNAISEAVRRERENCYCVITVDRG